MTDHLTQSLLNQFADGELSAEQVAGVNEHLAACQTCTASALSQMVLKSAVARAGRRYAMPEGLRERLLQRASDEGPVVEAVQRGVAAGEGRRTGRFALGGWAAVAAMLLLAVGVLFFERGEKVHTDETALVTEAFDEHVGTLAANQQPQVLSSDRHTVKPWFQGKLPFSFNLPEGLPSDTTLDGANLVYLHGQPVAQLLYSIGKHRVSVFVRERAGSSGQVISTEQAGFHVASASTADLELVAVSDVDASRLRDLVGVIARAQAK
jgi:anti-sigma factor RsiW